MLFTFTATTEWINKVSVAIIIWLFLSHIDVWCFLWHIWHELLLLHSNARFSFPVQLKHNFFSLKVFLRSCIPFTFSHSLLLWLFTLQYRRGFLSLCFVCNSYSRLWSCLGSDLTGLQSTHFKSSLKAFQKSKSSHLLSVLTRSDLILGSLTSVNLTKLTNLTKLFSRIFDNFLFVQHLL